MSKRTILVRRLWFPRSLPLILRFWRAWLCWLFNSSMFPWIHGNHVSLSKPNHKPQSWSCRVSPRGMGTWEAHKKSARPTWITLTPRSSWVLCATNSWALPAVAWCNFNDSTMWMKLIACVHQVPILYDQPWLGGLHHSDAAPYPMVLAHRRVLPMWSGECSKVTRAGPKKETRGKEEQFLSAPDTDEKPLSLPLELKTTGSHMCKQTKVLLLCSYRDDSQIFISLPVGYGMKKNNRFKIKLFAFVMNARTIYLALS